MIYFQMWEGWSKSSMHASLFKTCSGEILTHMHKKACVKMLIATLFTTVKTQRQPKCPSTPYGVPLYGILDVRVRMKEIFTGNHGKMLKISLGEIEA